MGMQISDLIREPINELLKKEFIGKTILFQDADTLDYIRVVCENVEWVDDDGYAWVVITANGTKYTMEGQGIDIWYVIKH